jgi:hypothetical protein
MSGARCIQVITSENTRRCAHTLACLSWWRRAIKTRDVTRTNQGDLVDCERCRRANTAAMDSINDRPETHLLYSTHISRRLGLDAYLKLEVCAAV